MDFFGLLLGRFGPSTSLRICGTSTSLGTFGPFGSLRSLRAFAFLGLFTSNLGLGLLFLFLPVLFLGRFSLPGRLSNKCCFSFPHYSSTLIPIDLAVPATIFLAASKSSV